MVTVYHHRENRMNNTLKPYIVTSAKLAFFTTATAVLLLLIQWFSAPALLKNQQQALLAQLNSLIPSDQYNNDLVNDHISLIEPSLAGKKQIHIYRARYNNQPVASLLTVIAPNGYSGEISLLVAIRADDRLAGVRVLAHKETPGLGDYIEVNRSDWIQQFTDKSYQNTPPTRWKVKKDGGDFTYRTGATITPRAIVAAVERTLHWVSQHHQEVYAQSTPTTQEKTP